MVADDELIPSLTLLERPCPGGQWTTAQPVGTATPAGIGDAGAVPLLVRTPDSMNEHPAAEAMADQGKWACCCACCADQVFHADDGAPGAGCGPGVGPVALAWATPANMVSGRAAPNSAPHTTRRRSCTLRKWPWPGVSSTWFAPVAVSAPAAISRRPGDVAARPPVRSLKGQLYCDMYFMGPGRVGQAGLGDLLAAATGMCWAPLRLGSTSL